MKLLFSIVLCCQIFVSFFLSNIKPNLAILPQLPSQAIIEASSFGDKEFYFRILSLGIQNAGDSFGRATPLKNYDYSQLYQWLNLLDKLDKKSDFIPALASYYYGNSQKLNDINYIVQYLDEHYMSNPKHKWWWLYQAVFLANHRLEDKKMALILAIKLSKTPGIPLWAKQMPAFIHQEMGEKEEALLIIQSLLKHSQNLPQSEINFMNYFINARLKNIYN